MASHNKSWVRDLLILPVPLPQLRCEALRSSRWHKTELWEVIYNVRILLAQVLECCPAPSSCRGHECRVDAAIPVGVGVVAPCKKMLLQKLLPPPGLQPHLSFGGWKIAGLGLLVATSCSLGMIICLAPHGLAYKFCKGSDIHDVDEPEALLLKFSYPSA